MCRHENKHCQRCGTIFECKVSNITQCQCYGITLTDAEQQYISKQFTDCLCFNCIRVLRMEFGTENFATLIKKHSGH